MLALVEDLNLLNLLLSSVRDLASFSREDFARKLEERSQALSQEPHSESTLRLLGSLNELLDFDPRHYASYRDIEDNASDIVAKSLEILRSYEKDFGGKDLQALMKYQTEKLFGELGKRLEALSDQQQADFFERIRKFISALPQEQQKRLKQELQADELTDAILKKAIASGCLGAAFAVAVEIFGFSFYIAATSLVGTLTGLLGITLPFVFFTGLTSVIAVLANPLTLVLLVGGGGVWMYHRNNQVLRERLVPLVVS